MSKLMSEISLEAELAEPLCAVGPEMQSPTCIAMDITHTHTYIYMLLISSYLFNDFKFFSMFSFLFSSISLAFGLLEENRIV